MSERAPLALALLVPLLSGCADLLGIGDLDAGPSVDGGPDATTATEAAADAAHAMDACTPVGVPDAQPVDAASCRATDAGSCTPGQVAASAIAAVPPRPPASACTPTQIGQYYDLCTGGGVATASQCTSFVGAAANTPCLQCLQSYDTEAAYGPLVIHLATNNAFVNTGACIQTLDPCNAGCGERALVELLCLNAACTSCTTGKDHAVCTTAATTCPCGDYFSSLSRCSSALIAAHSPAAACVSGDLKTQFLTVATAMCSAP